VVFGVTFALIGLKIAAIGLAMPGHLYLAAQMHWLSVSVAYKQRWPLPISSLKPLIW